MAGACYLSKMADFERPFPNANELLDRVVDICPFPATAQRLMALANDEDAPLDAIAAAVQTDPALATQVLRVANSAAFRYSGAEPVRDLRQALIAIGLGELRTMAGAMALLATFATRDELSLDLHRTSAVSGSIAAALVPGATRSLPFVCGLLCEVGALACLAVDGPAYVDLLHRAHHGDATRGSDGSHEKWSRRAPVARDELETKRYGTTTRAIGARLLRRHNLPYDIANAIEAAPRQPPGTPLVHRATAFTRIATPLVVGRAFSGETAGLAALLGDVADWTSLFELDGAELARRSLAAAADAERAIQSTRS